MKYCRESDSASSPPTLSLITFPKLHDMAFILFLGFSVQTSVLGLESLPPRMITYCISHNRSRTLAVHMEDDE